MPTIFVQTMGMSDAFDFSKADLSGIASGDEGNIYISKVLHKTVISVDEKGTKAGAVTATSIDNGAAPDYHEVYLDRPFVYMLIECKSNTPFFIGVVNDIGESMN